MSKVKYRYKNFLLLSFKNSNVYIIYNKNKTFANGHTHIYNFEHGKYLMRCAYKHTIDKNFKIRDIYSLIRISNNKIYKRNLQNLLIRKEQI